uniref:Uncharacterized protein n=1 Tax=Anguilla anguilla TaxID=7936 RepID=A0A0E9XA22_ANGAN
MEISALFVLH